MAATDHPPRRRALGLLAALVLPCTLTAAGRALAGGPPVTPLTPWKLAIDRDQLDTLQALIARGDVRIADDDGWTPLHHAAVRDFADGVSALLRAGAPVDARTVRGATPLHGARPKAQALLLAAGASAQATDGLGRVPLHQVPDPTEGLLPPGVDVRDVYGMTPLHLAAYHGNEDKIDWLLAHGADPKARTTAVFDLREQPGWREIDPQHRFEPGQRPLDLVNWQYDRTKWATSAYSRAYERLDAVTPRAGLFRR